MNPENKTEIYSNNVSTHGGFFDVALDFATSNPPPKPNAALEIVALVRVRMSWTHVKALLVILADMVLQYEKQQGDLPLPPELAEKWEKFLTASGVKRGGAGSSPSEPK